MAAQGKSGLLRSTSERAGRQATRARELSGRSIREGAGQVEQRGRWRGRRKAAMVERVAKRRGVHRHVDRDQRERVDRRRQHAGKRRLATRDAGGDGAGAMPAVVLVVSRLLIRPIPMTGTPRMGGFFNHGRSSRACRAPAISVCDEHGCGKEDDAQALQHRLIWREPYGHSRQRSNRSQRRFEYEGLPMPDAIQGG